MFFFLCNKLQKPQGSASASFEWTERRPLRHLCGRLRWDFRETEVERQLSCALDSDPALFFLLFCNCTIILKFRHIVANPFCLDLWSRWFMVDFRERWKMMEIYYPFEGGIDSLSSGVHHFLFLLTGQTRMSILSPVHHHDRDFCWSFEHKTNKSKVDKQLLTPHLFTIEHEDKQVLHFFNPSDIWPLKLGAVGPNFPTSLGCFYSCGGFTNKNESLTTKLGI